MELPPVYILRLQVRLQIHPPSWVTSSPRRPTLFQPNDSTTLESHTISSDYMGNSAICLHHPGGRYFCSQMTQLPLKVTQFPRITWVIQSFDCITRIARRFCNQMNKKVKLIKNYIYIIFVFVWVNNYYCFRKK